jgi:hypothetical protein
MRSPLAFVLFAIVAGQDESTEIDEIVVTKAPIRVFHNDKETMLVQAFEQWDHAPRNGAILAMCRLRQFPDCGVQQG